MLLTPASYLYGAAASWRRRWYARDPARRRRLSRPVISVGNLCTGGSGKTPVVAHLARLLVERGERPAILSRGYARTAPEEGVTVVSDGVELRAALPRAGDEPLMLARALKGVAVLVSADRYAAGRMAEERFGATVHLLDDGFQHVALERDVDLLVAGRGDLADRVLPAGHLREPLAAAAAADALLVRDAAPGDEDTLKQAFGIPTAFTIRRAIGPPRWVDSGAPADLSTRDAIAAVAGIARPDRFFVDLAAAGWHVAATQVFRDHHPYTERDLQRVARAARAVSATVVVTTEKDAVRLPIASLDGVRFAAVPLTATIEPPSFIDWLLPRLRS